MADKVKTIVKTSSSLDNENGRTDYGKVLVIGPSGFGKSYLAKTADLETTGYVNAERKPLPFKAAFKYMGRPKTWAGVLANIKDYGENPEIKNIIVDSQSMAFDMLHLEMKEMHDGFKIYSNYNTEVARYFNLIRNIQKDIIVISHDETLAEQGFKMRKAKVHGKEFEGRVEAYYTTVLFADKRLKEGRPEYFLKTFQEDCSTKVPEGLFGDDLEIPNSASYIFKALEDYYS